MNLATAKDSSLPHADWAGRLTEAEHNDFGDLFPRILHLLHREGRATSILLQAELGVSACRALRILDALERIGFVPPPVCTRPRAAGFEPGRTVRVAA